MQRLTITAAVCLFALFTQAQVQPLSPEEAAKRLAEKQAARQADRAQLVSITKGELDDLRAELARVKAELAQLRSAQTTAAATPAVKLVPKIAVGISKEELTRFLQVHKSEYELRSQGPDVNMPAAPGQPQPEKVVAVKKARHKVYTGIGSNGVNRIAEYREEMRPDVEITVHVLNNQVSSVDEQKVPTQRDEVPPLR